ncbi:MAG: LemA family protein [Candidatus Omnitrophica bacterium]|nr:LemA family protein [Candidatus Omnitrophota bacterium]
MTIILLVVLTVAAVVILLGVGIYNKLVQLRENTKNGWSQIDVQLKRRHDLIPNLVETAKGYMAHERSTLENVIKARQQAVDAKNLKDKQAAENFLSSTLRSLFAVSENYPNLKADQQMRLLHEELTSTENKITFARQYYNDEVNRLNTAVQSFPDNVIANMFNFGKRDFFELEDASEKAAPQVKF